MFIHFFLSAYVTFIECSSFYFSFSSSPPCQSLNEVLSLPCLPSPFPTYSSVPDSSPSSVPLQVYHRRSHPPTEVSLMAPANSPPALESLASPSNQIPIVIRKGVRYTHNLHPIYIIVNYHRLSSPYCAFISSVYVVSFSKSHIEALSHPGWRHAMLDKMIALQTNDTWELVLLPPGNSPIDCRWIYNV